MLKNPIMTDPMNQYDDKTRAFIAQSERLNKIIDARLARPNWSPWSAVAVSAGLATIFVTIFAIACYYAVH